MRLIIIISLALTSGHLSAQSFKYLINQINMYDSLNTRTIKCENISLEVQKYDSLQLWRIVDDGQQQDFHYDECGWLTIATPTLTCWISTAPAISCVGIFDIFILHDKKVYYVHSYKYYFVPSYYAWMSLDDFKEGKSDWNNLNWLKEKESVLDFDLLSKKIARASTMLKLKNPEMPGQNLQLLTKRENYPANTKQYCVNNLKFYLEKFDYQYIDNIAKGKKAH
jgi:hypothetical protein